MRRKVNNEPIQITFTGRHTTGVSSVRASRGERMSFMLLNGIQVGTQTPLRFEQRAYDTLTVSPEQVTIGTYSIPTDAAQKLAEFARICFLGKRPVEYSSLKLINFLSGFTRKPGAQMSRKRAYGSTGTLLPSSFIKPGYAYTLIDDNGGVRLGLIGLRPHLAVTVLGINGPMVVSEVLPLTKIYRATGIAEVHGIV